ncbi:MAG: hypothetical protein KA201_19705 [Kofleriaceae bacterium]|nr:hypothetical protein [Kofleriaceae bacterium]
MTTERQRVRRQPRPRAVAIAVIALLALVGVGPAAADDRPLRFVGSVQLDYLTVPTADPANPGTLDGSTLEVSLRASRELGEHAEATIKVCFACHGFEAGAAYVDLRAADELVVRFGRMTPAFGSFPERHDPANHHTSDKPLVYDMGRMLELRAWNEGILPAPWVDNGVEVRGTHFVERGRLDYAAYLLSGPKAGADATDFDFTLSRSPGQYYTDTNSQPIVGARVAGTIEFDDARDLTVGGSAMAGTYDPGRDLDFVIAGVDAVARLGAVTLRGEYLVRRTRVAIGDAPALRWKYGPGPDGTYADYFVKDGFYLEGEVPVGRVELIARWDGLRRKGNVLVTSPLTSRAAMYRYTAAAAVRIDPAVRLKGSVELYDLGTSRELALHLGVATPF